jgi:hypothetical protein
MGLLTLDGPCVLDQDDIKLVGGVIDLVQVQEQLAEFGVIHIEDHPTYDGRGPASMERGDFLGQSRVILDLLGLFLFFRKFTGGHGAGGHHFL